MPSIRISPPAAPRGLLICLRCGNETMERADTLRHRVAPELGAVLREKTYRCTTEGCDGKIKTREVSDGETSYSTVRAGSERGR